jgi:hypothetical protein
LNIEENAFKSDLSAGKLQFTTPSLSTIFGAPFDYFNAEEFVTFTIGLIDTNPDTGATSELYCPPESAANCEIVMNRLRTPFVNYINPRVLYDGTEVSFFVNPKQAARYKISTENFFTEARIN